MSNKTVTGRKEGSSFELGLLSILLKGEWSDS